MNTNLLITKPVRPSKFHIWAKAVLFIAIISSAYTGLAQTRLGLHVTQEELNVWRQRATATTATKYKISGDVSPNSPGDWNRIQENATAFKNNKSIWTSNGYKPAQEVDRWIPWTGTGAYPAMPPDANDSRTQGNLLKDAAFYYMLFPEGNASYAAAVKKEIFAYVQNTTWLDFNKRARWVNLSTKNSAFNIAQVLTKITFAYDYLRIAGAITTTEQQQFETWITAAAMWLNDGIDAYYDQRFVDRVGKKDNNPLNDYLLTDYSTRAENDNKKRPLWHSGPAAPLSPSPYKAGFFATGYNNRGLTEARFVAQVAVLTNNTYLLTSAKRIFKEFITYGVFAGGDFADMERWYGVSASESYYGPETGLEYSFSCIGGLIDIADVLARNGDESLYNFTTEAGAFGTAAPGNPKSLLQCMQNMQKYLNGSHIRYGAATATLTTAEYGTTSTLINGLENHQQPRGEITYDVWLATANKYYRNASVTQNYKREAVGTRPYPLNGKNSGPNHPWGGQAAVYPGVLFMFGQMENIANPFRKQPLIIWNNPAAITYGKALSTVQLNATTTVNGTFIYTPALGTVLNAGVDQELKVEFIPTDNVKYATISKIVTVTIDKAVPLITWNNPAVIPSGTALNNIQLNATTTIPGTFVYTPALGTVLKPGIDQELKVEFIPTDKINYVSTIKTVNITVEKAVPIITWNNPAAIISGTALSNIQLNATTTIPGTFVYTPALGAVLNAGIDQELKVNFTPTGIAADHYTTASKTVQITVTGGILREYWANISGSSVSSFSFDNPPAPTSTTQMPTFQGPALTPGQFGIADNYATYYRGYLCVPVTGKYTFWLSSDNDGELWLSTDKNSITKAKIAFIKNGFSYANQWDKYASQKSISIDLEAGKLYYVEGRHKEGGGGDQFQVAWRLPNSTTNPIIIPGNVLSPFVPVTGNQVPPETITRNNSNFGMQIFPNPSRGKVFINFTSNTSEHTSIDMYDMQGGLVSSIFKGIIEKGEEKRLQIDAQKFASGIYIIRLTTPNKIDFQKLLLLN